MNYLVYMCNELFGMCNGLFDIFNDFSVLFCELYILRIIYFTLVNNLLGIVIIIGLLLVLL